MGGSLTEDELTYAKSVHKNKYFVETGTYKADTTIAAAAHFDHVYTMEIHEGLHKSAVERCKPYANITLLLGDSVEHLCGMTEVVQSGAVFFLDAHISGSDSGWNGAQLVPMMEEIDIIMSQNPGPSVFILDDVRLWKNWRSYGAHDWSHINENGIRDAFRGRIISLKEENDRLWIITK